MATSSEQNEDPHIREVKEFFEKNGIHELERFIQTKIEEWQDTEITIAETGNAGVGKSSFINAIRG